MNYLLVAIWAMRLGYFSASIWYEIVEEDSQYWNDPPYKRRLHLFGLWVALWLWPIWLGFYGYKKARLAWRNRRENGKEE